MNRIKRIADIYQRADTLPNFLDVVGEDDEAGALWDATVESMADGCDVSTDAVMTAVERIRAMLNKTQCSAFDDFGEVMEKRESACKEAAFALGLELGRRLRKAGV